MAISTRSASTIALFPTKRSKAWLRKLGGEYPNKSGSAKLEESEVPEHAASKLGAAGKTSAAHANVGQTSRSFEVPSL